MNKLSIVFSFALMSLLPACATHGTYVSRQSDPQSPTFTVIPSWQNDEESDLGASVETALMKIGLQVVERPAFVYTETSATRTTSVAYGGAGVAAGDAVSRPAKDLDVVAMYSKTSANYIVVTSAGNYRARIIRRDGQALVASVELIRSQDAINREIYDALAHSGILKDVKLDTQECKPITLSRTR